MIELRTPNNIKTLVPESVLEDDTLKFNINELNELNKAKKFYEDNGYVIFKKMNLG